MADEAVDIVESPPPEPPPPEPPPAEAPPAEAPPAEAPPAEAPPAEASPAEAPPTEQSPPEKSPEGEVGGTEEGKQEGEIKQAGEEKQKEVEQEGAEGEFSPEEAEEPEYPEDEESSRKREKEEAKKGKGEVKPKQDKKTKETKETKPKGKQDRETQTGKEKKGKDKKQKPKKEVEIQVPTGEIETEDQINFPEGESPTPKGKKGKGGKEKKGKKGKKEAPRLGQSFSEFLEYRASQQIESDEWTWESYSVSEEVLVEPDVKEKKGKKGKKGKGKKEKKEKKEASETPEDGGEKPEKSKKEKKGKKGKKGKKEEKPAEEPQPPAEVDILAEINKMKALAEAQTAGEVAEEVVDAAPKKKKGKKPKKDKDAGGEPKEKKPKGPKLTKKQKAALAAEQAKIAEKEAEIAAKKAAEEERIRLIEERKANIEKEKREIREQQLRIEQLNNSLHAISNVKERCMRKRIEEKEEREWDQYLKCDGLPDPNVCGEMNTYLHLWNKVMETTTMDEAAERTNEALHLLNILTNLIDDPEFVDAEVLSNWKWMNAMFSEYQQKSLDAATYKLLRDIEKNLDRLDLFTADYKRKEENFTISLWLLIYLPPSLPNPKKPEPPRVHLDFPEINMNVLFPTNIHCKLMAIRAMYLKYDHLSRETATFDDPPQPEQYEKDLRQVTDVEWRKKLFYKYEARRNNQAQIPLSELPEEERLKIIDIDNTEEDIPSVPYQKLEPTASEFVISEEDQVFMNLRERMVIEVEEHVINLRRFMILGGVYFLNLYYQPPQPKDMVTFVMTVTRLEVPPHLSKVPFHKTIETLHKKKEGEEDEGGEEEEEEEATQEEIDEFREQEINRLILIKFQIPTHVLLFEPPILCQWYRVKKVWSTADIHEFEYDSEEKTITFKSGKFGSFAIATPRYLNFPFRCWEIKANEDATITFMLATQLLTIIFNVKENLVCITELNFELEDFETDIVDPLIGEYYKLPFLIRVMREIGIEIFPPYDAFSYIEGTCEKYLIIETFLYKIMGYLSISYNFVWSRWNFSAGRRNMVMLMREYKPGKPKQPQFSTLMVTPLRANFINCTEESEEFDGTWEDMTFYSDLFNLIKSTSSMYSRLKVQNASPSTAVTLSELLLATRLLSMC